MFGPGELVLQLQTSNKVICEKMMGAEVVSPTQIAVVSDFTAQGDQDAIRLHQSLRQILLSSGMKIENPPCRNTIPHVDMCRMLNQANAHNILVLVAGERLPNPHPCDSWINNSGTIKIIPVLPEGISPHKISSKLKLFLSLNYKQSMIDQVAPDIFSAASIGVEDFRIFISYTHQDARGIADSIFESLSKSHFNVYLDRFRGTPGRDFLVQIEEELADKACVLVLETLRIHESKYVRKEINHTIKHRMGLMAIAFPGSRPFRGIGSGVRLDLTKEKINASNPRCRLKESVLNKIIDFVRQNYLPQMLRRRRFQSNLMRYATCMSKLPLQALQGPLYKTSSVDAQYYSILTTPQLPSTNDFRQLDIYSDPGEIGVIIGPLPHHTTRKFQNIDWVSEKSNIHLVNEVFALEAAKQIKQGGL